MTKKTKKVLITVLLLVLLLFFASLATYYEYVSHSEGLGKNSEATVYVRPGETLDSVLPELAKKGIISSVTAFKIYQFFHGSPNIRPGYYRFLTPTSFPDIYSQFKRGPTFYTLNVIPGETIQKISQALATIPGHSAAAFLREAESGRIRSKFEPDGINNLEGLILPNTYEVYPSENDKDILSQMVSSFDAFVESAGLSPGEILQSTGLNAYQILIVASIIVRESGKIADDGKIARVIINRLQAGMKLQMDSTVDYAAGNPTQLTKSDYSINSPYNTYLYPGLPPTPIATFASYDLIAAMNPTPGPWLYFVLISKDGSSAFATTYQEQLRNVEIAKERGLLG